MNQLSKIETYFESRTTPIARDLKLNLIRLLSESALDPVEANLSLLALAGALNSSLLRDLALEGLNQNQVEPALIREASESAALMGMLNTYYSFRYKISQGDGNENPDYQTAGLRMTALARPTLGKERFEMLAFAVSVINGCESCIRAHEKALKDHGISGTKIHDLAKLAAVAKGVQVLTQV